MSLQTADPLAEAARLLTQGDLAGAERIAQARGNDPNALHLLALVRARQNRLDEAATLLGKALALVPGQPQMLFNYGKLLAALQRDGEALAALQAAATALPNYAEAWNGLAEVQRRLGDAKAAEISLRKALALEPKHLFVKLSLGTLLNETQAPHEAETLLADGLAQAPEPMLQAAFAYNLALAQQELGKRDAALENLAKVRALDPAGSANLDFNRANLLLELSRPEEAEAMLHNMVRHNPGHDEAHLAYNKLLHGLKREGFLASYDSAPPTTPLQLGKASLLAAAGRTAEAEALYAEILAREPDNIVAVSGLAEAFGKLDRHGEAVAALENALARAPGNITLQAGVAGAALQAGDPQKAAAMAENVLAQTPHDQLALALLGSAWRLMQDDRHEMLNGYDDLIQIFDLEPPDGFSDMAEFNKALNAFLDGLHDKSKSDVQSLRRGSQTYGKLFSARYPLVEKLRSRIEEAMARYIAAIKPQAGHAFRERSGGGFRFEGSWSSRLGDYGHHVNHVHHLGWISSSYYVDVPKAAKDKTAQEGWIKFGEPPFAIGLEPRRAIQPVPGRLVLFPSYMWHGTIPFKGKARTTIAFDAVPR